VISSPNVAFNGFGYPAYITAPAGGLLTLRSLWLTSAWDEENEVTISAGDERGQTVGEYVTTLSTDNPREIDFTKLPKGSYKGTFEGVKHIGIDTWATQVRGSWHTRHTGSIHHLACAGRQLQRLKLPLAVAHCPRVTGKC
jgi:hypothetical protein